MKKIITKRTVAVFLSVFVVATLCMCVFAGSVNPRIISCPECNGTTYYETQNRYDNTKIFGHCSNDVNKPHYEAHRYRQTYCNNCFFIEETIVESGYYCKYGCGGFVFYY